MTSVALHQNIIGHRKQQGFLSNSFLSQRLPNTFLFVGPSGVGKRKVAISFVQQVFCEGSENLACGFCPSCQRVAKEQHESLLVVEPEGHQIKIKQARQIIDFISFKGLSKRRFILINQFELINRQAANALLKSLEEPPEGTHFILISQSLSGVLPTVRSRSQILQFASLDECELRQYCQAEDWVFKAAQGSFESLQKFINPDIEETRQDVVRFWSCVTERKFEIALSQARKLATDKSEIPLKIFFLQQLLRDAMVVDKHPSLVLHQDLVLLLKQLSQVAGEDLLGQWASALLDLEVGINNNFDRILCFENFAYKIKSQLEVRGA